MKTSRNHSMPALLAAEEHPPVRRLQMPYDQAALAAYWTAGQAAKAWCISYQAARCWLWGHLEYAVILELMAPDGVCRFKLVMAAGQDRVWSYTPDRPGNPCFRNSEFQTELSFRRWKRKYLEVYEARKHEPI